MFRVSQHPSSGVLKTVTAASCTGHNTGPAASLQRGLIGRHSRSEFFIDIKYFRSHYGPGDDSASNRNEYQEHLLGVNAAGA